MKNFLLALSFLLLGNALHAQDKYFSKTGHVWFFSHTPMEDVEAHTYQAGTILDAKTGDLMFTALIQSFEFKKALMQEHFNENYMESEKFPKATFKGKILDIAAVNFAKDGTYLVKVQGSLSIHGVTKEVQADGKLEVKAGKLKATSTFVVAPSDYAIVIPSLVKDNIAKTIQVNVDISYEPYSK